jgi:hypothetical protein
MDLLTSSILSFCLSDCLTIRTEEALNGSHEILTLEKLLKFIEIFKFWLKSENKNGHFKQRPECVPVRISKATRKIFMGMKKKTRKKL